jgi:GNAT superfamily N-acetyltransferase
LRASLELREYREQLVVDPGALHLPHSQIANGQVIVAELNGRIAGFLAVVAGELDSLFVEPDLWGRGIGRALINAGVHRARKRGLALKAIVAPGARRFYESCGFSIEGETDTRFGPAFRMSK